MSIPSINNVSNPYSQLATGNCTNASKQAPTNNTAVSTTTPGQSFLQMMSSFESTGAQNQGQSVDPLSVF
jgi:hypothetical protein